MTTLRTLASALILTFALGSVANAQDNAKADAGVEKIDAEAPDTGSTAKKTKKRSDREANEGAVGAKKKGGDEADKEKKKESDAESTDPDGDEGAN